MNKKEAILLLNKEKTIYSRREMLQLGITDAVIKALVHDDYLTRVQQGKYSFNTLEIDSEYILQLSYNKCIISHESALYHLGYSERVPEKISVTLPTHFGTSRLKDKNLKIRYCAPELLSYGVQSTTSIYGNPINIYNLERTLCDIIRHYKSMDREIANKAIRKYCTENQKRLSVLMLCAKKMDIADKVKEKLEVLI